MSKKTVLQMETVNEKGDSLKVTIEGKTDMPFWKHDLKLEAVKSLLETVDKKDFYDNDKEVKFHQYIQDLRELLDAIE